MVIKESQIALAVEGLLFPLAIVDVFRLNHLNNSVRICEIHYDNDRVLKHKPAGR